MEEQVRIPVAYHVVRSTAGLAPPAALTPFAFANQLDYLTDVFDNGMSFYLCAYEFIDNDVFFNNVNSVSTMSAVHNLPNVLNVYVVNSIMTQGQYAAGVATLPGTSNASVVLANAFPRVLAHEAGHFFGLLHTFGNTNDNTAAITKHIRPDNTWNSYFPSASDCFCCGDVVTGYGCPVLPGFSQPCAACSLPCNCNGANSGDFIADTPVDPGFSCPSGCGDLSPCNIVVGGEMLTYFPDRDNIMSYFFSACTYRFSAMQKERMKQIVLFHPTRSNLLEHDDSNCSVMPTPAKGLVSFVKSEGSEIILRPFSGVSIYLSNDCETQTDEEGLYSAEECNELGLFENISFLPSVQTNSGGQGPGEGVTVMDLILIRQHILGIAPLSSPYSWIAADASGNGIITTLDLIHIQRVILGIDIEFPVPSWRFVPSQALASPPFMVAFTDNPFLAVWQSPQGARGYTGNDSYLGAGFVNSGDPEVQHPSTWGFVGVKTGDANLSACPDEYYSISPNTFVDLVSVPHITALK